MNLQKLVRSIVTLTLFTASFSFSQCDTWTTSTIRNCNGIDYELWNQNNAGSATMKITGGEDDPNGGTFEASWSGTINILARAGKKWGSQSTTTASSLGKIELDFAATWTSSDNVKMLGVYGWAYYPSGQKPTQTENGQTITFSNQIEYYIIQDRGSYNPATGGTNAKKYGEGTIDGIDYEFYVADRIGQPMLTGNGNFKQYFSIPKSTSDHRQSGLVSIDQHFKAWEEAGMKIMDCPLYEIAMKVESYNGSNGVGSAKVTRNILTMGGGESFFISAKASPEFGGKVETTNTMSVDSPGTAEFKAIANPDWEFIGWEGDTNGTDNPILLDPLKDFSITALFEFTGEEDTTNLLEDGDFPNSEAIQIGDNGSWKLAQGEFWGDSQANSDVEDGTAILSVIATGEENYQPQLLQYGLSLEKDFTYKLTFKASAAIERKLETSFQKASSPWTGYASKEFNIGTEEKVYEMIFTMENPSDPSAQFAFNLGQATGEVYLSDVRLVYVSKQTTSNLAPNELKNLGTLVQYSFIGKSLKLSPLNTSPILLKVLDSEGKLKFEQSIDQPTSLSLGNYPKGRYFLSVKMANQQESLPFLLK